MIKKDEDAQKEIEATLVIYKALESLASQPARERALDHATRMLNDQPKTVMR